MNRGARVLWLSCALATAFGAAERAPAADQKPAKPRREAVGLGVGFRPPPFAVTDLGGASRALSDYRGKVLVLHFWASWCPFCRGEVPKLKQVRADWPEEEVAVLTVSTDEDLDKLRGFLRQETMPYPVVADAQAAFATSDQYGVSGIPVTYVISPDGHIAAALHGSSDIVSAVRDALEHRAISTE